MLILKLSETSQVFYTFVPVRTKLDVFGSQLDEVIQHLDIALDVLLEGLERQVLKVLKNRVVIDFLEFSFVNLIKVVWLLLNGFKLVFGLSSLSVAFFLISGLAGNIRFNWLV